MADMTNPSTTCHYIDGTFDKVLYSKGRAVNGLRGKNNKGPRRAL